MRSTFFALLVIGASASAARAHPTGFALLTVDVEGEQVDAVLRVGAGAERAREIEVVFPEGCEERAPTTTRAVSGGVARTYALHCATPLRGELRFRGLPVDLQARIEVRGDRRASEVIDAGRPVVRLNVPSGGVLARYVAIGAEHIAIGVDHVLFVVALVLLVPGWRRIAWTVSAFTLGHSVTLALASLGLVHVSSAPVEACIALSVLFVAREVAVPFETGTLRRRPEVAAGLFGLLHGLGFAGALTDVGIPDDAVPLALFGFNLGVELGQLVLVAVVGGSLAWLGRVLDAEARRSWVEVPVGYVLGAVAACWTLERVWVVLGA
ncbi:MAG: HupE/UreJ family protein [Sandaracinus sp.]|nr:HupE/UreJ family protein [Sandaracinus sp.]MCB9615652.1 HupE/UreJ family protein [Sandaracinus sp.]MCB9618741.1 HupE/UreJ family protein [Sandaracinus sp.]MCB9636326.1 HupE/UreJ family protein [Sandaracinus sp.]